MVKNNIEKIRPRQKDTHKGDYGHIFILAGSAGMTGAAFLTSQAALLSGSGLVTLGIPKSLNPINCAFVTERNKEEPFTICSEYNENVITWAPLGYA